MEIWHIAHVSDRRFLFCWICGHEAVHQQGGSEAESSQKQVEGGEEGDVTGKGFQ